MRDRRVTLILASLTLLAFVSSLPGSAREAFERGGLYLFSQAFFEDIPKRLTGPGRFRFVLQPLVALLLGIRDGVIDAQWAVPRTSITCCSIRGSAANCCGAAFDTVVNLMLMGILLDSIAQWLILRRLISRCRARHRPSFSYDSLCACACVDKSWYPVARIVKEETISENRNVQGGNLSSLLGKLQSAEKLFLW